MNRVTNALSVDVEEWFQAEVFAARLPREEWEGLESRVEAQTDIVLDILERRGARATFFVLGWVAERRPGLLRRISDAGHELACHGHSHTMITKQDRRAFTDDIERARGAIEAAAGRAVRGYRAPTFSVTAETVWALEALWEAGFSYDSSIYPIRHDRYGIPSAPRFPYVAIDRGGRRLWEFPGPTLRVGRLTLPAAGGGYLRLFPYGWTRRAVRELNRRGQPATVFVHPWEFDRGLPRIGLPLVSRVRHYGGIGGNARKLRRLLDDFSFAPMGEVMDDLDARCSILDTRH